MKHSSFLLNFIWSLEKKTTLPSGLFLKGCSTYLLNPIIKTLNLSCLVVFEEGVVYNPNEVFWGWSPREHCSLCDEKMDVPDGFDSEFGVALKSFQAAASSGFSGVRVVSISSSLIKKKLFSSGSSCEFFCDKRVNYGSLIKFLETYYKRVDFVARAGDFAVRGGVVDVFPFLVKSPVRVVFSFDAADIYRFDLKSQQTKSSLKSISFTAPRKEKPSLSVLDFFSSLDFLLLIVGRGGVSFFPGASFYKPNLKGQSSLEYSFGELGYSDYCAIKNKSSVSFSSLLLYRGYSYGGDCVFPEHYRQGASLSQGSLFTKSLDSVLNLKELVVGDYLVHENFGVALYRGVKTLKKDGVYQDFLILMYEGGAKVSVDVNHLDLISFYSRGNQEFPLDSLGKTGVWKQKRSRAKLVAEDFVLSLYKSHLKNKTISRAPYSYSSTLLQSFVDSFVYKETEDQHSSWLDILYDLSGERPMNRVLCGDVGFGKTEIAMRSAFVAALSGVRCLVLCPTTILASQHFQSFSNRLSAFGASVGLFSNLQSKTSLVGEEEALLTGNTDVLIATHKILFNTHLLGLFGMVIVDEEHRFGVKHKEKINSYAFGVDTLYMSATPIPRTLHLGLVGFKSFSTIKTPPQFRLPVITKISYYNKDSVRSAIYNEILRGGQIFFIHNSIDTLERVCGDIVSLCPEIKISFIHSKLSNKKIKTIMSQFINKNLNILVATSIVESGIDIKNVNTIIINNAHMFGLSQLYQLRGRVGRGDVQSYAYLFIPKKRALKESSLERLKIMQKNNSLGVGYEIAKKDLEIRGGGSVFGYQQSGATARVGYEFYTKLVDLESKKRETGSGYHKKKHIVVKNSCIPQSYVSRADFRVAIYRQFELCSSLLEINRLSLAVIDLFGPSPLGFSLLLLKYKIKTISKDSSIVLGVVYFSYLNVEIDLYIKKPLVVERELRSFKPNFTFSFNFQNDVFKLCLCFKDDVSAVNMLEDIIVKLVHL